MPLPDPKTPWPPPEWTDVYDHLTTWDAWYSNDPARLAEAYGGDTGPTMRPSQLAGGVVGRLSRWFWGTPQRQAHTHKLHVPVASDIAATSADLLFAEPPTVRLPEDVDEASQTRLAELFGPDTTDVLIEAAEVAAALSGVYLRVGWDRNIADRPLVSVVHPDAAIPVFRWGRLVEVTFHREVERSEGTVWRHLEHHAPGVVQHALYVGDSNNLGRLVPLTEHPATVPLVDGLADDGQSIPTNIDSLTATYVPNARPNRRWRTHPHAYALGRSDFDGIEPLMDALDEAYTSWMRDVRLAKARLLVPSSYLETGGRGGGAWFDADREVFTELNMLGGKDTPAISAHQFAIRHAEHAATCAELFEQIVRGAGYSAQTFGLTGEIAMTATESNARERKTLRTRGKKVRHWRQALSYLAEVMLAIDNEQFGRSSTVAPAEVTFAPAVLETRRERAEAARMLLDAEAASVKTRVQLVNPDWDEERVNAEVEAITGARPDAPEDRV